REFDTLFDMHMNSFQWDLGERFCASMDTDLAFWFHQRLNATTGPLWKAVSFSAGEIVMTTVIVTIIVILLVRQRWMGFASLVLSVPGGALLGEGLKLLVQRPRPYLTGMFVDWSGYSFPSGHTLSATLLYGFTALWLLRKTDSPLHRAVIIGLSALIVLLV